MLMRQFSILAFMLLSTSAFAASNDNSGNHCLAPVSEANAAETPSEAKPTLEYMMTQYRDVIDFNCKKQKAHFCPAEHHCAEKLYGLANRSFRDYIPGIDGTVCAQVLRLIGNSFEN